MKKNLPNISKEIDQKEIYLCLEENYNSISMDWFLILEKWMVNSYSVFRDHEKYLILIYLVKKTFDFYSRSFIKFNWEQFFALKKIDLGKFNIINVAKELKISRETARRKIGELQKDGIIKKTKSGIIVQTDFFNQKFKKDNEAFIKMICIFISKFSILLFDNKILKEKIKAEIIEKEVINNFSYAWKLFFEMQIPLLIGWKVFFIDLETWHIWGIVLVNQNYEMQKYMKLKKFKIKNRKDFSKIHSSIPYKTGINAMSISSLTGIPRATVIRKLKKLVKNKHLTIDDQKLYYPNNLNFGDSLIFKQASLNMKNLSVFLSKILNLVITSK